MCVINVLINWIINKFFTHLHQQSVDQEKMERQEMGICDLAELKNIGNEDKYNIVAKLYN